MQCHEVHTLIEEIAAGELDPDPTVADHFAGCQRCQSRLAHAHAIEAALAERTAPIVPDAFTSGVMARIRRERWRAEQLLDAGFNVAVITGILFILAGIGALFWLSGLLGAASDFTSIAVRAAEVVAEGLVDQLQIVLIVIVFLTTSFAVWWWTEEGLTP
jgi:anti-sigma factor RsiW